MAGKDGFHRVVLGIFQQNQYSATMEDKYHWAKVQSISKIIMGVTVATHPFPEFHRVFEHLFNSISTSRLIAIENGVSHTCDLIFHNETC